jgi:VWFA-related protein
MKLRFAFLLSAVCAALLLAAFAQTPAPAPATAPSAQTPVLKVTTHLVQVNVVVHGKKNEPVTDLTKDDFTILDDNHPQKIATFAMESSRPADAKPQRLLLPQNTFTNKPEFRPSAAKAVTVILLDSLNSAFEDQVYAKKQLISFLQQLRPEDSVALYALGTRLQVLHDFTTDAASLIETVNKHKSRAATELADSQPEDPDTGSDDLDSFLAQAQQKIADMQMVNRVSTTMAALEAIANHVSVLPGRKNLIWISGGFPFHIGMDEMALGDTRDRRMFTDEMEHAARAVTAAQLAIYPVDARGLVGSVDYTATVSGSKNARMPPQAGPSKKMKALYDSHDTMNIMAERTGGKAYYNSNDLKNAIRGAIDDAQVTYILGYYPTHNNWDGKFHNLKVQITRKGVNVRNRLGYFAFAEVPQNQEDRRKALREAAWSALEATQLGLVVRAARDIPQPGRLRVVLSLDLHTVNLEQKGDRWVGGIDILFVQQPGPGQPAAVLNDALSLNLTKDTYAQAMKTGLRFGKDLDLASAGYLLRVAARDVATGNVGSVNIPTGKLKPEPPPAAKPEEKK